MQKQHNEEESTRNQTRVTKKQPKKEKKMKTKTKHGTAVNEQNDNRF